MSWFPNTLSKSFLNVCPMVTPLSSSKTERCCCLDTLVYFSLEAQHKRKERTRRDSNTLFTRWPSTRQTPFTWGRHPSTPFFRKDKNKVVEWWQGRRHSLARSTPLILVDVYPFEFCSSRDASSLLALYLCFAFLFPDPQLPLSKRAFPSFMGHTRCCRSRVGGRWRVHSTFTCRL